MQILLVYSIPTGVLTMGSSTIYRAGYSGHGPGLNNPAMCNVHDVGPLPAGGYAVEDAIEPDTHLGPFAFPLIPDPENEMFGRNGFYIHGDNAEMNHSASDGCIILPRMVRSRIALMLLAGPVRLGVTA